MGFGGLTWDDLRSLIERGLFDEWQPLVAEMIARGEHDLWDEDGNVIDPEAGWWPEETAEEAEEDPPLTGRAAAIAATRENAELRALELDDFDDDDQDSNYNPDWDEPIPWRRDYTK